MRLRYAEAPAALGGQLTSVYKAARSPNGHDQAMDKLECQSEMLSPTNNSSNIKTPGYYYVDSNLSPNNFSTIRDKLLPS